MPWPAGTVHRATGGLAYARGSLGGVQRDAAPRATIVLAHAVGFCKELWAPVLHELAPLLERTPATIDWLALDFSGHGASRAPPPDGTSTWDRYHAQELREVMRAEGIDPAASVVMGVGHSMGGAVLASLELRDSGHFRHVVAIEPPLFTRAALGIARVLSATGSNPLANAAARRRSTWPSQDAAREHFSKRSAAGWVNTRCIYICIYIYLYICIYVYMYICIYVYI